MIHGQFSRRDGRTAVVTTTRGDPVAPPLAAAKITGLLAFPLQVLFGCAFPGIHNCTPPDEDDQIDDNNCSGLMVYCGF